MFRRHAPENLGWIWLDSFYEESPARRSSAELQLGDAWDGERGIYRLAWLVDTHELCLFTRLPTAGTWIGAAFELATGGSPGGTSFSGEIAVAVIAEIATEADLDRRLRGWERQMARAHSVAWLLARAR